MVVEGEVHNTSDQLLNQVCAWFLEIAFVREVSMHGCVCVHHPGYERLFT